MKLPGIHNPKFCPGCQTGYPCRVITRRHHRYWENYLEKPDIWGPILAQDAISDAKNKVSIPVTNLKFPESLKEDPPVPREKNTYRIGLDLTCLAQNTAVRGIGRYSFNLLFSLCRLAPEVEFVGYKNILDKIVCSFHLLENFTIRNLRGYPEDRILGNEDQLDAYLTLSPVQGSLPEKGKIPLVGSVIYDVIPDLFPGDFSARMFQSYFERIKNYDTLLSLSEATKADFVLRRNFDPRKIKVVGADCHSFFVPPETPIQEPYLLYVGGQEYHKGAWETLEAFGLLPEKIRETYSLSFAFGITEDKKKLFLSYAEKHGVEISRIDYAEDLDLVALYQKAALTIFPSKYEGFGLPLLESIKCGTPVIYGNNSSQFEVVGEAGIPCDPYSPEDIARSIVLALNPDINSQLREKCQERAKVFSWEKVADKALRALGVPENFIRDSFSSYKTHALPVITIPERITFRHEYLTSWTGYGNIGLSLVKGLEDIGVGVDLEALQIDEKFRELPEWAREKLQKSRSNSPWCLWLSTPNIPIPQDKKVILFTMWEVDRLGPKHLENIKGTQAIIVPCQANREWFQKSGIKVPIYVIPLGVEEFFTPTPISLEPCVFGTSGRMASGGERKNISNVAAAFANVCDGMPGSILKIKIWEDCQISPWIENHPRIQVDRSSTPLEEMPGWYQGLTVYFTGSRGEGWGRQVHEAMACGRPVAAVPWSATTDFWRPNVDGWALDYTEVPAVGYSMYENIGANWAEPSMGSMEETMLHIYNHPEEILEYGKNASEQAHKFTWEKTARKLRRVLGIEGMLSRKTNESGKILDLFERARACPFRINSGCGCQGGSGTCGPGGIREGNKVTLQECAFCLEENFSEAYS